MTRHRRTRLRGRVVLVVILSAIFALTGCGPSTSTADQAQQLADELFPGQLYVIDAELQPGTLGFPESWVTYGFVDDPDAAVQVRGVSAERLRPAVAQGRRVGAELRALRSAFGGQQLELVTVGGLNVESDGFNAGITISADLNAATVAALTDRLDAAVRRWVALRGSADFPDLTEPLSSLSIGIVDPDDVASLPKPAGERLPRVLLLSFPERQWAVEKLLTYRMYTSPDADGRPWPAAASLAPILTEAEQTRIDAAVRPVVTDWLAARRPDLHLAESRLSSRLEPDSVEALRTYVVACPTQAGCKPLSATHAVALTVDLATLKVSELRLLKPTPTATGSWSYPLEPERIPR